MGGKNHETELVTIKFGTRVRHADGAEGRIVWANASAVKIEWNDGEKVTWRRSELASKGLVVVAEDEQQVAAATEAATESEATPVSEPSTVPAPAEETTETASPTSEEPVPGPAAEQQVTEQPAETAAADSTPPVPKTRRHRTPK